ncbi:MAG: 30S ribosomal protein S16 [Oligoflexia bacterium]|nr:30S ribosomal protein S16 [Oligoflexia bacterium]
MTVIRLARVGYKHNPKYRVVVADSRKSVKGRFIELIGHFDPLSKDKKAVIDKDKYQAWVKKGAKPSQRARSLFAKLG